MSISIKGFENTILSAAGAVAGTATPLLSKLSTYLNGLSASFPAAGVIAGLVSLTKFVADQFFHQAHKGLTFLAAATVGVGTTLLNNVVLVKFFPTVFGSVSPLAAGAIIGVTLFVNFVRDGIEAAKEAFKSKKQPPVIVQGTSA